MTQFKFYLVRKGAPWGELQVPRSSQPEISFSPEAEVKMTLSGVFRVPPGINYMTDRVSVVMVQDGVEYPMGKYILTDPTEDYQGGSIPFVSLSGFDLTQEAQTSCFEARPSYAAGMLYTDVIRRLLVESGITSFYIEPNSAVLQTTREDWEPGVTRLQAANDLLQEINYRTLWADKYGMVRADPYRQPVANDIAHVYRHQDTHGTLLPALQRTWSMYGLHNVFVVYLDSPDYPAMRAVVENKNPASPVSIVSRNKRVPLVVKLDNIASEQHLKTYAQNLSIKEQIATESIEFETRLEPMHGFADVIALYRGDVSGIYQEYGWRIDAVPGGRMQHTARKVLYLL